MPDDLAVDGAHWLGEAISIAKDHRATALLLEAEPTPDALSDLAAESGFEMTRDLYQMRRELPLGRPWSLPLRPFRPGEDDTGMLAVNNRAFEWHPEQGGWDSSQLAERMAESWFDPRGLLIHEVDGTIIGFCWTKVHHDLEVPIGEIYVIAVDPDAGGRGIGQELLSAGLDHLAGLGLGQVMLYVESDNHPALRLYRSNGFDVHLHHTWWRRPL